MFYNPYYDTQPQPLGEPPAQPPAPGQEAPMNYFTPEMLRYMQQYQQYQQYQQQFPQQPDQPFPQEYPPQNYPQPFEGFYGQ